MTTHHTLFLKLKDKSFMHINQQRPIASIFTAQELKSVIMCLSIWQMMLC